MTRQSEDNGSAYQRLPGGPDAGVDAANGESAVSWLEDEVQGDLDEVMELTRQQEPSAELVNSNLEESSSNDGNRATSSTHVMTPILQLQRTTGGSSSHSSSAVSAGAGRCRVCLDPIPSSGFEDGTAVHLGCACRNDLEIMHLACAEKWFGQKGSTMCEVCGQEAVGLPEIPDLRRSRTDDVLSMMAVAPDVVANLPWMSWRVVGISYLLAYPMVWMTLKMQKMLSFSELDIDENYYMLFEISLVIVLSGNLLSWVFCKLESIARQRYSLSDYVFKLVLRFALTNYLMGRLWGNGQQTEELPQYYFCLVLAACEMAYAGIMTLLLWRYLPFPTRGEDEQQALLSGAESSLRGQPASQSVVSSAQEGPSQVQTVP